MNKKQITLVIILSIIVSLLAVILLSGWISAQLATNPSLQRFKIFRPQSPIVINRREEVRISDVENLQEAADKIKSRVSLVAVNRDGAMVIVGNAMNLTSDGYFLTTKAIFTDPKTVYTIVQSDGKVAAIESIITDPASSVALVKTRLSDVAIATIGDSKSLEPGEKIIFVKGSTVPFSVEILSSIVTASERENFGTVFSADTRTRTFGVQNPGSSLLPGHLLINLDGEVIGMWDGSHIVPADVLQTAQASYFVNKTAIVRPQFGFQYKIVTPAESALLVVPKGAYVTALTPSSPAVLAGLAVGDTITKIGEVTVDETSVLEDLLEAYKPADPVSIVVFRAGKSVPIIITAGTLK